MERDVTALLKAVPMGAILTLVLAMALGTGDTRAGVLEVFGVTVDGHRLYWSWALFVMGTGVVWGLLTLKGD